MTGSKEKQDAEINRLQLAQAGLIDEYQILLNPVVLGQGRTMFDGIAEKLILKLAKTRSFGNGNILLCYVPTT
jgi:dihydrofolate reductase